MWIAQRHGQNWRDERVLAAVDWLASQIPKSSWDNRAGAADALFQAAKVKWAEGHRVPLFDPSDAIAWYLHQARCYADPTRRQDFFEPEGYRVAPIFMRLGQLLPTLRAIDGGEERAMRLMTGGKSQPDDGIYELLVAGAYARRAWDKVAFVPETGGFAKRPDLFVDRARSRWAVECKRAGRSGYAKDERLAGERMANRVHAVSRAAARPIVLLVRFDEELCALGDDYLYEKVSQIVDGTKPYEWKDEGGSGVVMDVRWEALHGVLKYDDIYFGSSRMVQLLLGGYDPSADYSVAGDWTPSKWRPLHATWVDHVSLVVWKSLSEKAELRKAQHFRGVVARASQQLPGDRPGVIHVGYEAAGGNSVDGVRHRLNELEMVTFDSKESHLRMVYGNYFMPEHVTARDESAAITETTVCYRVGSQPAVQPLPSHLLFSDERGQPGSHLGM